MKLMTWFFNWTNWHVIWYSDVNRNPSFGLVKGNKFLGVFFLRRQYVVWGKV
jgi:hypothetical protein